MKIINWNVGRPSGNKSIQIIEKLIELNGDIVVLTETNSGIKLPSNYLHVHTDLLPVNFDGIKYKIGENRVSIWTKYPILKTYNTYDKFISICAELSTPLGIIAIYGTIIGILGGKGQRFKEDLTAQISDYERLVPGRNFCIIGDFNIIFNGYAYPSLIARQTSNDFFDQYSLKNLTESIIDCVDHIAMSKGFTGSHNIKIETWNHEKALSDQIGTAVVIGI